MDGWRRIGLDDAFPIRQVLPVGVRFWCWARWARFFIEIIVYYSGSRQAGMGEGSGMIPFYYLIL